MEGEIKFGNGLILERKGRFEVGKDPISGVWKMILREGEITFKNGDKWKGKWSFDDINSKGNSKGNKKEFGREGDDGIFVFEGEISNKHKMVWKGKWRVMDNTHSIRLLGRCS